jgi:DNA polymerase III subunit epsilon
MELVAIDFETANETRASMCSCGIALVADGKVVDKRHWLIQPKELRFNSYNVQTHGIDRNAVVNRPRLCELWDEIRSYLDGRIVLAHNASFDMSVLRKSLDGYEIDYPQLEYSCTYLISQQTWKDWGCFALSAVACKLNIDFSHHNAAEDARACAEVALMAMKHLGVTSFDDLEDRISVYRGRLERSGYCTPYHPGRRGDQSVPNRPPMRARYKANPTTHGAEVAPTYDE